MKINILRTFIVALAIITCLSRCSVYCIESNIKLHILEDMIKLNKPSKELFKLYHLIFEKSNEYNLNSEEGIRRYKNFKVSLREIKEHNAKPDKTFTLGLTQFSDMTQEEFSGELFFDNTKKVKSLKNENMTQRMSLKDVKDVDPTKFEPINWLKKAPWAFEKASQYHGRQGTCVSDGYVAIASAAEINYNIKYGEYEPIYLSPQSLTNCHSKGCTYNILADASSVYKEVVNIGFNIDQEPNKAFNGNREACVNTESNLKVEYWETGYGDYFTYLVDVKEAISLLNRGPFLFRSKVYFSRNYKGGLFYEEETRNCDDGAYVSFLLVGYDIDENGQDYWIVKGNYGPNWGENGYMRLSRSKNLVIKKDQDGNLVYPQQIESGIVCNFISPIMDYEILK